MFYREDKNGQILQEGINEAGRDVVVDRGGDVLLDVDTPMIPFFIYYSMFGFQRIGDLIWAAGDMRARGFLIGGTAGRTTLNGEGLQHEDGHSHIMASTIPNCVGYDPTYAYELAVIMQDGLRRMFGDNEDVFYYITMMNENYPHPAMPAGAEEGILRASTAARRSRRRRRRRACSCSARGTILREVEAGAELLAKDFGVAADIWSATSFTELRRDGLEAERWNLLHPGRAAARLLGRACLGKDDGPGHRRDRLHEDDRRPDPAVRAGAATGSAPTASAARDYRAACARSSRSTAHVAVAALKALADDSCCRPGRSPRRSSTTTSTRRGRARRRV